MSQERTWTCDGCGHEHALRKIDSYRWVNKTANASGERLDEGILLQLCPRARLAGFITVIRIRWAVEVRRL